MTFLDRRDAGRQLADALAPQVADRTGVVLALPRGGVPVGFEVAQRLGWPLDVYVVRKLGAPQNPELAIGAVATGGQVLINEGLVRHLHVSERYLESTLRKESAEVARREALYRGDRPRPTLKEQTVILVDDGLATGATARVALAALSREAPAWRILAVPVGSTEAVAALRPECDALICLETPLYFMAVGMWYTHFEQTSDEEVIDLLAQQSRQTRSRG
jgi:putative phosphoribosyl transferase